MTNTISLAATVCTVVLLGAAAPAHAAFHTFVSGNGNDAADCLTPETACRQIDAAIAKTLGGGTVAVLPGEYAPFTVGLNGEQHDIIAQEGLAVITGSAIAVPGGGNTPILVNVDGAADMPINIKGFTINAGSAGIVILGNAPQVVVENCTIAQFGPEYGIDFRPSGGNIPTLYVTNTTISRAVGSGSGGGIRVRPTGTVNTKVVLDNARVQNNPTGLRIDGAVSSGAINVTVRNSTTSSSGSAAGIHVSDAGGGTTNVMIEGSTSNNNATHGVRATGSNTTIRMRDSTVSGNLRGLLLEGGGQIISHGGNVVAGNTTNGSFSSTVPQN